VESVALSEISETHLEAALKHFSFVVGISQEYKGALVRTTTFNWSGEENETSQFCSDLRALSNWTTEIAP